jgi:hypothetical protein
MPENIIGKLNAVAADALADQTVRSRLVDLGEEIFPRRLAKSRCREMVADHQGIGYQAGFAEWSITKAIKVQFLALATRCEAHVRWGSCDRSTAMSI